MKTKPFTMAVLMMATLATAGDTKPTLSQSSMAPDQIAVYQSFLTSYNNGSKSRHLNLARRTSVFDLSEKKDDGCLKGIAFDEAEHFDSIIHQFDPASPLSPDITVVDPEEQNTGIKENDPSRTMREGRPVNDAVDSAFSTGLLTLSEVAFDKSHQYAAMSFSFVCGGLCGHGGTVVFKKQQGKWKQSKHQCSSWIS